MARKLPQLQRVLDAPALASVAYGEIASSIYFALGIIALHALGFAPVVLGVMGLLFLLVALSYAEGTASIRETGGAATFVRVAFNDLAGFLTGWALFLDYLIVIALSALFVPHYLGIGLGIDAIATRPGDVVFACCLVGAIALGRLLRRPGVHTFSVVVPLLDLVTQLLLVGLGFGLLFSGNALTRGLSLGTNPSWHAIAFALPLAMLAYTGLETVANYAEEVRRPGRDLPRSLFSAIGVVVIIYVLIALVGLSAFPSETGTTALGVDWQRAPLMGIVFALGDHLPGWADHVLRVYVGITGALILVAAATTSISGFGRLAYSLGEHGQLPAVFGRLHRRTLVAPISVIAAAVISIALLVVSSAFGEAVTFLGSLFSFGVLLAFTAAQLAVVRLRMTRPDLRRPFRVPLSVGRIPVPA
ncbi:MAG TPA: APC family permease, partial [Kofleriaceae bacterium]|nr:APC family permease [Kofleriaceae bacterium]